MKPATQQPSLPSLRRAESVLGPARTWAGNCFAIATAFVGTGLVKKAVVRYGHFLGDVSIPSTFYYVHHCTGWVQHSWIEKDWKGKTWVIDPTRWTMEAVDPYIYCDVKDGDVYDVGGNKFRATIRGEAPPFKATDRAWRVPKALIVPVVEQGVIPKHDQISMRQLHWLATQDPAVLGRLAKPLFVWVNRIGQSALIPIDNRELVLGKGGG